MSGLFAACRLATGRAPEEEDVLESPPALVRTASKDNLSPEEAVLMLRRGNKRYVSGGVPRKVEATLRQSLMERGQNPAAVVIGCADSRCPPETLFDAMPGDLFVLRNAGNALAGPEASIVASTEFAVGALGTKVVLVLGHTKCGALAGATKFALSECSVCKKPEERSHLDAYLESLAPAAKTAKQNLRGGASQDEIVAEAIRVNVFNTLEKLVEYSPAVREKVASGEVQLHGAVYDIASGEVSFMGQPPKAQALMKARAAGA